MALESSRTILYVAKIWYQSDNWFGNCQGDQNCTQTHTHTHTHTQTQTQTDTHTHLDTYTDRHTHTEAYFISLVFLRKCRNKTKKEKCLSFRCQDKPSWITCLVQWSARLTAIQEVPGSIPGYTLESFLEVQGLERGPPSLVRTIRQLFDMRSSEIRLRKLKLRLRDKRFANHKAPCTAIWQQPLQLVLTLRGCCATDLLNEGHILFLLQHCYIVPFKGLR